MHMTHSNEPSSLIQGTVGTIATPPPLWGVAQPAPNDGRERLVAVENMWSRASERLAYPRGTAYPIDEEHLLITESGLHELHRLAAVPEVAVPVVPVPPRRPVPKTPAEAAVAATLVEPPSVA